MQQLRLATHGVAALLLVSLWCFALSDGAPTTKDKSEGTATGNNNIVYVSRENFTSIVYEPSKNVLVRICTHWSPLCRQFADTWRTLYTKYPKITPGGGTDLLFADFDLNMDPTFKDQLELHGIPTLWMYPKGNEKKAVEYVGSRDYDDVMKFIRNSRK